MGLENLYKNLKKFGKDVGEDGKIFLSKATCPNKDGDVNDGRCDMDADYTIKETYYKDKNGVTQSKKKTFFGYRYHLLADVNYELPVEYTVTKASKGEREQLKKQIESMDEDKKSIINTLSADKGYDSEQLIEFLKENGISPVIDIQNHSKNYHHQDIVLYLNSPV